MLAQTLFTITQDEIESVIQALDKAFQYLELNCGGMSTDELWDAMGLMHNLKSAETGELYWNPRRKINVDTFDTDYFD